MEIVAQRLHCVGAYAFAAENVNQKRMNYTLNRQLFGHTHFTHHVSPSCIHFLALQDELIKIKITLYINIIRYDMMRYDKKNAIQYSTI